MRDDLPHLRKGYVNAKNRGATMTPGQARPVINRPAGLPGAGVRPATPVVPPATPVAPATPVETPAK